MKYCKVCGTELVGYSVDGMCYHCYELQEAEESADTLPRKEYISWISSPAKLGPNRAFYIPSKLRKFFGDDTEYMIIIRFSF